MVITDSTRHLFQTDRETEWECQQQKKSQKDQDDVLFEHYSK